MEGEKLIEYINDTLNYTLFTDDDSRNEVEWKIDSRGLLMIPRYPIVFELTEKFYYKVFDILSIALSPQYVLQRPLTMQIVELPGNPIESARALLFPIRYGKPHRISGGLDELIQKYSQTGRIPIMDGMGWDYVKSPHAIITGVSGSGKSYFLKVLYLVCSAIGETVVIDPKGSDLARLSKINGNDENTILPDFVRSGEGTMTGDFLQKVVKVLKNIETKMYARQHSLYEMSKSVSTDYRELGLKPLFVFIDELAALITGANKGVAKSFQDTLTKLVVLGREAGIYLVLSLQSAKAEYINTMVRDSLSMRIQLGRINKENTRFLFPELTEIPMVPLGSKGTGIISIAGDEKFPGIEPVATPTLTGGI